MRAKSKVFARTAVTQLSAAVSGPAAAFILEHVTDPTTLTLTQLAHAYRTDELCPSTVTEAFLAKLGSGPVYRLVTAERARAQAARADALFDAGTDLGPLQGVPLALKDLMDTKGDVTAAGSKLFLKGAPATRDCPAAARLDAAGAVFLGKTNMTELAFSGLGLNPHFGTPANVFDAARVPGGSSSGAGVAVASGLACAAIGSDTGGSVRIPAAFNGLVGLKTTDKTISTEGCVPLSTTLDTLGPLTRTAEDAWHVWRALLGAAPAPFVPTSVTGLRVLAPTTVLQKDLDDEVAAAFTAVCEQLVHLEVSLETHPLPVLDELNGLYGRFGSFAALEALALYEDLLGPGSEVDPRVATRILAGRSRSAADYIRLGFERTRLQKVFWEACADFDVVLAPTVAALPPKLTDLQTDEAYFTANSRVLRNTAIFNLLGVPAISVPCAPLVGVMVAARPGQEALVLSVAAALGASS